MVKFGGGRDAWSLSSRRKRRGELLLTDGRPSLELLRLLGLSRLQLGAVGKNALRKKKVPQRCFHYGPGSGLPSQHAMQPMPAGVRLMYPQNPAPPPQKKKSHIPPTAPQHLSCGGSRPLLPNIIGAKGTELHAANHQASITHACR